jgi:hypothetical protein
VLLDAIRYDSLDTLYSRLTCMNGLFLQVTRATIVPHAHVLVVPNSTPTLRAGGAHCSRDASAAALSQNDAAPSDNPSAPGLTSRLPPVRRSLRRYCLSEGGQYGCELRHERKTAVADPSGRSGLHPGDVLHAPRR